MKYIIFDFQKDLIMIDSFLKSASTAHKQSIRTEDWFLWKFRDNPFGESILACAVSGNNIVGCVALGMQDFIYMGNSVRAAISFETFVHPDYQGHGMFKKLITLAEKEAQHRKIKFLLNFPNSNSLPGFVRSGWTQLHIGEYWIKPRNILHFIFNITQLRKGFKPSLDALDNFSFDQYQIIDEQLSKDRGFSSVVTKNYIEWRFFTFPVSKYIVINNEFVFAIARVGYRGKFKEVQILFFDNKKDISKSVKVLKKDLMKICNYDLVSFPISKKNKVRASLIKIFCIKVPNKTNVTYKVLDKRDNFIFENLELQAINYHTY